MTLYWFQHDWWYWRDDDVRSAGYSPLVKWRFELEVTQLVLPQPIGLCGPHHQTAGCLQYGCNTSLMTGSSWLIIMWCFVILLFLLLLSYYKYLPFDFPMPSGCHQSTGQSLYCWLRWLTALFEIWRSHSGETNEKIVKKKVKMYDSESNNKP